MKKARVLLWAECNRNCDGCCNKDWDLTKLPKVNLEILKIYDEIILTGGEPMLKPTMLSIIASAIRHKYPKKRLILYTAKVNDTMWHRIMNLFDGVTVTLHDQQDLYLFESWALAKTESHIISKRLNVFSNVKMSDKFIKNATDNGWVIKDGMKWIKNCPLPQDEEFVRWSTI